MTSYGAVYSPKLSTFIEENQPASRHFSPVEIESIAQRHGWEVKKIDEHPEGVERFEVILRGAGWFTFYKGGEKEGLEISWVVSQNFQHPTKVRFHPSGSSSLFWRGALESEEIFIVLPEPKVELVVPDWAKSYMQRQGWHPSNPLMCFASELEEYGRQLLETAKIEGVSP